MENFLDRLQQITLIMLFGCHSNADTFMGPYYCNLLLCVSQFSTFGRKMDDSSFSETLQSYVIRERQFLF